MRKSARWLLLALGLAGVGPALFIASTVEAGTAIDHTREVLALTTATRMDSGARWRHSIELQNLGPNAIYCSIEESTKAVVLKARKIGVGDPPWALDLAPERKVYCIAATAAQLTTAATIVTELE